MYQILKSFDPLVIGIKEAFNGPPKDHSGKFYKDVPSGKDFNNYLPFALKNVNYCQGNVSETSDPADKDTVYKHWLAVSTELSFNDLTSTHGPTGKFFMEELQGYDFPSLGVQVLVNDRYGGKYMQMNEYHKRVCQETSPVTGEPYGEPFEFYNLISTDRIYVPNDGVIPEWREAVARYSIPLKSGVTQEDYGTTQEARQAREEATEGRIDPLNWTPKIAGAAQDIDMPPNSDQKELPDDSTAQTEENKKLHTEPENAA